MKTGIKISVLWLCLLLLLAQAPAAVARTQQGDDAKRAREILDQTAQKFRQAGGVEMHFTLRLPDGGATEGRISVKDTRFRLDAEGMTTWFDGITQWTLLHGSNEVNVSTPTAAELQSINPYAWLALYKQGYRLATTPKNAPGLLGVTMTATDPHADLHSLTLWVEAGSFHPVRVSFMSRGSKLDTLVEVERYKDGMAYTDSHFRFDPKQYPDAEVIDLR